MIKASNNRKSVHLVLAALLMAAIVLFVPLISGCETADSYWDTCVKRYEQENKIFLKNQIVFVGDSITDGYDIESYYSALSLKCYNRGIGGDISLGVKKRFKVSVLDLEPSKLVVLIGINDLNSGVKPNTILANYEYFFDELSSKLPSCKVFVQSVYPINYLTHAMPATAQQIIDFNAQLKTLAESRGHSYINVFDSLKDENNLLKTEFADDGLHPNAAGYQVITQDIMSFIAD